MGNELISVIVPVYNTWRYLDKCIGSIANQTYKNLEIILVDDGSTDKSGEICDAWKEKDKRVKVIHKENGGAGDARNVGMKYATGSILSFIDSDDYLELDMYEILYKNMLENKSQIAAGGFIYEDYYGETVKCCEENYVAGPAEMVERFLKRNDIGWTMADKIYRKEVFDGIEFQVRQIPEDVGTIYKVLDKSEKTSHINKPVYHYIQRNGSVEHSEYNKYHMGAVNITEGMVKLAEEKYPKLLEYAEDIFIMSLNNNIVLCYRNNMKEEYKSLIEKSKEYMLRTLKNKNIKFGRKVRSIIITYFGCSRFFKK